MIEEKIKELEKVKSDYEDKKDEIFHLCDVVLKKIYKLQTEYNKKNRKGLYLIDKTFDRFETDRCKILKEGIIEINYYDLDYDCYDARTIELPPEIFEDDTKLQKWFDSKVSEFEESIKKDKREKEDQEFQEYLRLKEKYEN